jgi:cohesin loading factor subunit SCC2
MKRTPNFGLEMMPDILRCITDESVAVRKRAMEISKVRYLQNPKANASSEILKALLYRTALDSDPTIQALACQIIKEIWISPHTPASTKKVSFKTTLVMTSHLCLMAGIVQEDPRLSSILTTALQIIFLHPSGRAAALRVYSLFVATMFSMIDKSTARGNASVDAAATFQLILIFAKTDANIFTMQQIQLLQPYVENIGTRDDIIVYRCVISILRRTLPLISDVDQEFLRSTSIVLIKQITLFQRAILNEVIPCLWAIGEKLEDNEPLTNLALSCLEYIRSKVNLRFHDPINQETVRKVKKLLLIAGICGRHCHFQPKRFQMKFAVCHSVSEFMIGTFLLFSSSGQPMGLREAALYAICRICQVQPEHFTSSVITTLFEQAFEERNSQLETVILHAFKELLIAEEQHSKVSSRMTASVDHIGDSDSQIDGVAAFITQKYVSDRKDLMRIVLATQGDQALLAVEVLSSMTRQGLLHPKDCAQVFIALGTSQNVKIAELSFSMLEALHRRFGSIIENKYLQAVDITYEYQRDVVGNVRGATCDPYRSILHRMMEVTRTGGIKDRAKFFKGLCARLEPDPFQRSWIDLEQYLQRSRFILDNMAYFRYASVEELNAAIAAMKTVFAKAGIIVVDTIEDVFAKAGIAVVDTIETELLGQTTPLEESGTVNMDRLRTLAVFSTVLSGIWDAETYLCQQYGLSGGCISTTNETPKSLSKAPNKVDDIDGRAFWERNSMMMTTLDSEQAMLTMCRAFIRLFQEGIDFKVDASSGSYSTKGVSRKTGAGGGKLKGRKRKAPPK